MGFYKDIQFEVPTTKTETLTFHDIVGVSWSLSQKTVTVTVGSWINKEDFERETAKSHISIFFTGIESFEGVSKIIDQIINDPGSIFNGGVKE